MHKSARVSINEECFAFCRPFRIARGVITRAHVVRVQVQRGSSIGQGEAWPAARFGESVESVVAQLQDAAARLQTDLTLERIAAHLPAGAARNALDCAMWDLLAKETGRRVWELSRLPAPRPVLTAFTIVIDTPERMAEQARITAHHSFLKVKLGGGDDLARIRAVRAAAPNARLIVDVNEGWSYATLNRNAPVLFDLGVELIEQPLPASDDDHLRGFFARGRLCADESCTDRRSLDRLAGKYGLVNIKLDKCGGLSEAIELAREARARGFGLMVGSMCGTSLAMAPAFLIAQQCDYVDLDGPLWLSADREAAMHYDRNTVAVPPPSVWG